LPGSENTQKRDSTIMPHPLGYYVSGSPAIAALTATYGQQLQDMGLDEKMLCIKAISGALLDGLVNTHTEPSIDEQVWDRINDGYEVDETLHEYLTALDGCDETQCFALLTALIAYGSEEFRQFGSMEPARGSQDWEPDFS
jgi:hypothetical protein